MDLMAIRRGLMAQMASGAKVKTGTFVGDGTNVASINIGFEPDLLVISGRRDYSTSGWRGSNDIVFVKGRIVASSGHSSNSSITGYEYINVNVGGVYGDYGNANNTPDYRAYGTYSNGVLVVTNKMPSSAASMLFVSNQTYTWSAYKNM